MTTERTAIFLMANLGSDLSQLFAHLERGERALGEKAGERARGIIRELLVRPDLQNGIDEVRRIGDIIDDALAGASKFSVRREEVEEYFFPFALKTLSRAHVH